MHPMIRSALVLLAGVVVSVLVVLLMDGVVARIYPLPSGTDMSNQESLRQAIAALPVAALVLLVVGWGLAAGAGAYVAARLATHAAAIHGLIVALFVLVATVANLAKIPHPVWMWPVAIILIPVAGWVATRLVTRSRAVLAALAVLLGVAPGADAQQPGRPLIEEVAQAMGGRDRILAVRTIVLEGTGENYNLGQNPSPESPLPVYAVTELRRSIDFANKRWRHEQSREPRFPTANTAVQRSRLGYDSVAYDILPDGSVRRPAARADAERANELLHHPIGFLQVALAPGTELTEERSRGQLRHIRMNAGGNKFAIFIDRQSKLPVRIEKIEYHPVLGDAVFETLLSDWRAVDGLMLPMRTVWRIDGRWTLTDTRLSRASVNADVGDLSAPATARTAQPLATVISVTSEEIAPGVWYLAGQSHHSVAIEMRDHLLLVEAPQSDARTIAVIEKARTLRPGKPVRAVINTHHHFDHSGGVRAAIAEGLQVITHERNKALFEELAGRRHFIVADALAKSRRPARIQGVGARTVLSDGARNVEIHHIRGSRHAETLLMVYLPAERLLIEADVYSPPAPNATTVFPAPFAANLVENIDRLGLQVDRIVPIHGPVVPMSALRAAAAVMP